ncbi:phosphotransferase family protein [Nesterenkonia rhizosphaerae]|uniref:Aminoglycoside phosphotransferase domain-containing protein n=1 Tax=Nesterenkonia rhizosphaerae TaxID=1348272 RepID=A0ABP9FSE5_9MICC
MISVMGDSGHGDQAAPQAALEQLLRSEEAGELLELALSSAGLRVGQWRLEQIYTRPGAETSAKYLVDSGGAKLMLIISTVKLSDDQRAALQAVRLDSPLGALHLWAFPQDPALPGLVLVEDQQALPRLLRRIWGTTVEVHSGELLVLRPLRRAVHRFTLQRGADSVEDVYIKTVRPSRSRTLLQRHDSCALAPPLWDAGDGILVSEAARGIPLTHHLYRPTAPDPAVQIDPELIFSALHSISAEALQLPAKVSAASRVQAFGPVLHSQGAPTQRVDDLLLGIRQKLLPEPGPLVPTHGDFHPANLFVDQQATTLNAVIDTDTVGPGYAADDAATFFAHMLALPSFDPQGYAGLGRHTQRFWAYLRDAHDADDLAARTAAVLLTLAPGTRGPEQFEHFLSTAESVLHSPSSAGILHVMGQNQKS